MMLTYFDNENVLHQKWNKQLYNKIKNTIDNCNDYYLHLEQLFNSNKINLAEIFRI